MTELLFSSGRIVDLVLFVVAVEVLILVLLRERLGRLAGISEILLALLPGLFLLLALRAALLQLSWHWLVLLLALAFVAHLSDLRLRWRSVPSARRVSKSDKGEMWRLKRAYAGGCQCPRCVRRMNSLLQEAQMLSRLISLPLQLLVALMGAPIAVAMLPSADRWGLFMYGSICAVLVWLVGVIVCEIMQAELPTSGMLVAALSLANVGAAVAAWIPTLIPATSPAFGGLPEQVGPLIGSVLGYQIEHSPSRSPRSSK